MDVVKKDTAIGDRNEKKGVKSLFYVLSWEIQILVILNEGVMTLSGFPGFLTHRERQQPQDPLELEAN